MLALTSLCRCFNPVCTSFFVPADARTHARTRLIRLIGVLSTISVGQVSYVIGLPRIGGNRMPFRRAQIGALLAITDITWVFMIEVVITDYMGRLRYILSENRLNSRVQFVSRILLGNLVYV